MFRANLIFPYTDGLYRFTYSLDNPTRTVIINHPRRRNEDTDTYENLKMLDFITKLLQNRTSMFYSNREAPALLSF